MKSSRFVRGIAFLVLFAAACTRAAAPKVEPLSEIEYKGWQKLGIIDYWEKPILTVMVPPFIRLTADEDCDKYKFENDTHWCFTGGAQHYFSGRVEVNGELRAVSIQAMAQREKLPLEEWRTKKGQKARTDEEVFEGLNGSFKTDGASSLSKVEISGYPAFVIERYFKRTGDPLLIYSTILFFRHKFFHGHLSYSEAKFVEKNGKRTVADTPPKDWITKDYMDKFFKSLRYVGKVER